MPENSAGLKGIFVIAFKGVAHILSGSFFINER